MSTYKSTYYSRLYRDFTSIDPRAYRELVRFYEKHEDQILNLPSEEEYHTMLIRYVNALFEIGAYRKHLLLVDHIVQLAICHNIESFRGEDLFRNSLFRKSASLYNTHEFRKSEVILRQLVRIDPYDRISIRFLKKCLRRCRPMMLNRFRASTVFFLFLSALIIAIEVLFVRPFYDMHLTLVESSRNFLFIAACSSWIFGWGYNRWLANRDAQKVISKARKKLAQKEETETQLHI